ncbi:phage replication protein [Pseudomonas entomophila]|uniref:phage replication protein n=1 Tax=Pseudomonas entomophila TaxID=312306 RepID=UPI001EFF961A|nr:phage replication protein [Pseudomonas entomophila]MCG8291937.1 phage replication protein [Pseudomonas entomophila]
MQFTVSINQVKALEWGLNSQQALLFAFVYAAPSWAVPVKTEGGIYFALSKAKIIEELPLLTDKADTAYRMLKALAEAGLIELSSTSNITLFRLTKKAQEWNKKEDGSEKYPTPPKSQGRKKIRSTSEKNPSKVGKISEPGSEKSPTNQDTSNHDTNQDTSHSSQGGSDKPNPPARNVVALIAVSGDEPRCEIPADMPGPKDTSCKTYKAWANYAMAYRKRYNAWPVWNAKAGGQLGQLIDRLGIDVAHHVAAFFLKINDAKLINGCHNLGDLLAKCEAYHTQWVTNRQMNATAARQQEHTQANFSAAEQALEALRAKRAASHAE